MKKRRVAKLVALSMVAATLLTGVNVQAKEEKVVTAMTSIDLTPELCDPVKSGPDFRLYEMIYDPLVRYGENQTGIGRILGYQRRWHNLYVPFKKRCEILGRHRV